MIVRICEAIAEDIGKGVASEDAIAQALVVGEGCGVGFDRSEAKQSQRHGQVGGAIETMGRDHGTLTLQATADRGEANRPGAGSTLLGDGVRC